MVRRPRFGAAFGLMVLGLTLLSLRANGTVGERPGHALTAPRWSVARAAHYHGGLTGAVRVDGNLGSTAYAHMPDSGQEIVRGWLTLRLLMRETPRGPAMSRTLSTWEGTAEDLLLYQGGDHVRLEADPLDLPIFYDVDARAEIVRTPDGQKEVRYRGQRHPVPPEWQDKILEVEVHRAYLPARLEVVVVGGLDGTEELSTLRRLPGVPLLVEERTAELIPPAHPSLGAAALLGGLGLLLFGGWVLKESLYAQHPG